MKGRQVIIVNRGFSLEELEQFMHLYWDREQYGDFLLGKPNPVSIEKFIMLPATPRFMVIVYPRLAGSLFNRENKVILSVCNTSEGIIESLENALPSEGVIDGIRQFSETMSSEKERKGPAEDILLKYAAHMRDILTKANYVK